MSIFINLLLFLHILGVAMGVGGGIALSQVGPRLVAAPADARGEWWPLKTFFSRITMAGLGVLLVTGPLMLWLKYGGMGGMTHWFWAKMALLVAATVCIGISESASARFARGDEAAAGPMSLAGRLTGITMVLVILCAVFAFN